MNMWMLLVALFPVIVSSLIAMPRSSRYGLVGDYEESPRLKEAIRYDRNCFFSPVQCMLAYNDDRMPIVVTRKGKRANFVAY
ncbi:unnamed protein product [Caenorhabditis bovis]|uniref:Uncharacterized protein n=1 Tax=Caenorhabditis bovis TaxID=2654633 RepID=A0A8S1EQE2_9PELO|nr:unnamed protein product [Caenorhabditis bovis]